ncbi:MAG: argininosuccinate synthase [Armatimonadota bacterium]
MKPKCVLAYSGGLDTSVAIKWIADNYDVDVVAVAVDIGEEKNYEAIRKKGKDVGAVDSRVVDAKEEFLHDFVWHALKANLMYEDKYPAFTSLARPLIAKKQVEVAEELGAQYVSHGCTGKGNDQVRFELTYQVLNPELKVIAPAREWNMTREEAVEYAQRHGIPVPVDVDSPYSIDINMWGRSIECGPLEDATREPPEEAFEWTVAPEEAPDDPTYVEIEWERGIPVALDGERMDGVELIARLNEIGGRNGVGRVSMMENRLVGIKSRETYEVPAATILIAAHRDLESLTLDRETAHFKRLIEHRYADLVYNGEWYTPLREALDAFVDQTQEAVWGTTRVKLYKGACEVVGRSSPVSLYDLELATYGAEDAFDQSLAKGFIDIYALPAKVAADVRRRSAIPTPQARSQRKQGSRR